MKILRRYIKELLQEKITLGNKAGSQNDLKAKNAAFMSEYESLTKRNPIGYCDDRYWYMGEFEGKYCLVITNISEFDGTINFNSIQTVPPDICEKKGFASKVMNQIVSLADKHQVPMELQVEPFGQKSIDEEGLTAWYKRAGFVDVGYGELRREPK